MTPLGRTLKKKPRSSESLTFLIRYDDPKKLAEKSWTQSLAFWRDDESAPAEDILLVLTPTGTETRVDALDSQESQSDIGDQVLRILEESFLKNYFILSFFSNRLMKPVWLCPFFAFLIRPFLTIKLDPAPASHARHIFLTSDACIELIFPPKKIDSGVLPPKSIITY